MDEYKHLFKGSLLRCLLLFPGLFQFFYCTGQRIILPDKVFFDQSKQAYIILYDMAKIKMNEKLKLVPFYYSKQSNDMIFLKTITGDTAWQTAPKLVQIEWDPFKDKLDLNEFFNVQLILFEKKTSTKAPLINSVHYQGSNSALIGLKYMFKIRKAPVFIAGRIGALPPVFRYTVNDSGVIKNYNVDGVYQIGSERKLGSFAILVGSTLRFESNWYLNLGVGFGTERLYWKFDAFNLNYEKIGESSWALNENTAQQNGFIFETGLMRKSGRFLFNLGTCSVAFKAYQITAGVGLIFNHPDKRKVQ